MEGEAIIICIDTSSWMDSTESDSFKEQVAAIELYCSKKTESHPETVMGISGMGERCITHLVRPTRELWRIIRSLYDATICGYLLLVEAVADAHDVWFGCWDKELGVHLPKRIAVFAGGPVYDDKDDVQMLGEALKERNIACDAISFGDPARNKQELFDILVAAADNNGNCNVLHIPPKSSVRDALWRSQIIQTPFARLSKQKINPPIELESSELNEKAAAESNDPHDHPAKINTLSQSVVDLKQENAKPNSQPETLDLRIERAQRKLESLIMQKNKQVVVFNYHSKKDGIKYVKWVNEDRESRLPYDLEVYDEESGKEYIEVKTTDSARKDWFEISAREWEFAVEEGEFFSIARVILSGDSTVQVAIIKNPARLCQLGHLKLAVLMPKQQSEV
ncbi:hypothetical protein CTI12_AA120680 [Artemisia annua]|uniref:Protein NO VEIN C-terminal domain-containing protein n=1 Tax=Artemisia annua TaxID=35608 RepID=A0A2U1PRK2_ARTAN|nr:hypothetical protein CTI12_AA120680 [Artemisia annua]